MGKIPYTSHLESSYGLTMHLYLYICRGHYDNLMDFIEGPIIQQHCKFILHHIRVYLPRVIKYTEIHYAQD